MSIVGARRVIGRALDLTTERVRQLVKLGMPLDDLAAAVAWRAVHVPNGRKPRQHQPHEAIAASNVSPELTGARVSRAVPLWRFSGPSRKS